MVTLCHPPLNNTKSGIASGTKRYNSLLLIKSLFIPIACRWTWVQLAKATPSTALPKSYNPGAFTRLHQCGGKHDCRNGRSSWAVCLACAPERPVPQNRSASHAQGPKCFHIRTDGAVSAWHFDRPYC